MRPVAAAFRLTTISSAPRSVQLMQTHCVFVIPIAQAAPTAKSRVTPRVNGPRSLIRTLTELPFSAFVTVTTEPKGNVRWAAV
jgi:hypothetical protein